MTIIVPKRVLVPMDIEWAIEDFPMELYIVQARQRPFIPRNKPIALKEYEIEE